MKIRNVYLGSKSHYITFATRMKGLGEKRPQFALRPHRKLSVRSIIKGEINLLKEKAEFGIICNLMKIHIVAIY